MEKCTNKISKVRENLSSNSQVRAILRRLEQLQILRLIGKMRTTMKIIVTIMEGLHITQRYSHSLLIEDTDLT